MGAFTAAIITAAVAAVQAEEQRKRASKAAAKVEKRARAEEARVKAIGPAPTIDRTTAGNIRSRRRGRGKTVVAGGRPLGRLGSSGLLGR